MISCAEDISIPAISSAFPSLLVQQEASDFSQAIRMDDKLAPISEQDLLSCKLLHMLRHFLA